MLARLAAWNGCKHVSMQMPPSQCGSRTAGDTTELIFCMTEHPQGRQSVAVDGGYSNKSSISLSRFMIVSRSRV